MINETTGLITLSPSDLATHKERVAIVHRYMDSRIEAAKALLGIHESKSYKGTHGTFEAFAMDEFGLARRRAYQFLDVAKVAENVNHGTQIKNERQAREVAKAPPEMQQAVVEKATEMSEKTGKPVTAKTVAEARKAVMTTSEPDEEQYEDVDDEPETVEAKSVTTPEPTKAEQASKLKSMIKQHNAAMIRLVDDLLVVSPNRKCHERVLVNFREIDAAVGAWK